MRCFGSVTFAARAAPRRGSGTMPPWAFLSTPSSGREVFDHEQ
jgi:hypothetical protein